MILLTAHHPLVVSVVFFIIFIAICCSFITMPRLLDISLPLYPERQYSYLIFPIPPTALVALVAAIRELDMLVISEPSEIWLLHKLFLRTIIPPATVKVQSINPTNQP